MNVQQAIISLKGEIKDGQLKVDLPADLGDGLVDVELTLPEDRMPPPVISIALNYCNLSLIVTRAGMELWRTDFHTTGLDIVQAVVSHMRGKRDLLIGRPTAENLILSIGSALPLEQERTQSVSGRNLVTGDPARIEVSSLELRDTLEADFHHLEFEIKHGITPREIPTDYLIFPRVLPNEFYPLLQAQPTKLTGKYAGIKRLDERLQAFLGIPIVRADDTH